ncbi:hypothetical protein PsorP6_001359 [Peronosclerospora sorghi]|uniref:Uncharacterized protein n=1 Tax=Peronosclerospora sorghi TaxID=230839 RepID=A0ACC0WZB5_9STRA|nr:hypothetical protein PsorP6_001359 [Peronosclerospora sorghi]
MFEEVALSSANIAAPKTVAATTPLVAIKATNAADAAPLDWSRARQTSTLSSNTFPKKLPKRNVRRNTAVAVVWVGSSLLFVWRMCAVYVWQLWGGLRRGPQWGPGGGGPF